MTNTSEMLMVTNILEHYQQITTFFYYLIRWKVKINTQAKRDITVQN